VQEKLLKQRNETKVRGAKLPHPILIDREGFETKYKCWDPKDGELCLKRAKSGETLMEARSGSDVQIDC
jgi:hypothetical protein